MTSWRSDIKPFCTIDTARSIPLPGPLHLPPLEEIDPGRRRGHQQEPCLATEQRRCEIGRATLSQPADSPAESSAG